MFSLDWSCLNSSLPVLVTHRHNPEVFSEIGKNYWRLKRIRSLGYKKKPLLCTQVLWVCSLGTDKLKEVSGNSQGKARL